MLPRLRLKKPKFLLILFVIIFFLVFFVQQFNYEESDNSYQFKQNHKLSQADMLAQIKKSHLGSNFNHKYRNKKEESVHLITKAIDTMKRLVHLDLKGKLIKFLKIMKFDGHVALFTSVLLISPKNELKMYYRSISVKKGKN